MKKTWRLTWKIGPNVLYLTDFSGEICFTPNEEAAVEFDTRLDAEAFLKALHESETDKRIKEILLSVIPVADSLGFQ